MNESQLEKGLHTALQFQENCLFVILHKYTIALLKTHGTTETQQKNIVHEMRNELTKAHDEYTENLEKIKQIYAELYKKHNFNFAKQEVLINVLLEMAKMEYNETIKTLSSVVKGEE